MNDKLAYHKENADEFLDNVNNITSRIDAILKGDVTVLEEEARFAEEEKMKETKILIKEREAEEKVAKGIPGRGFKGNFKTFCKGCHTEYHHEAVEVCNNCGKDTVSNEVSGYLRFGKARHAGQRQVSRKFCSELKDASGNFLSSIFKLYVLVIVGKNGRPKGEARRAQGQESKEDGEACQVGKLEEDSGDVPSQDEHQLRQVGRL